MPVASIWWVLAAFAAFGSFGLALAYVNHVGGANAITAEEERAARKRK